MRAVDNFDVSENPMSSAFPAGVSLLPPRRLGRLLGHARARLGMALPSVSLALRGRMSPAAIRDLELGKARTTDEEVEALCAIYGISLGNLIPQRMRLILDREEGLIRAGDLEWDISTAFDERDLLLRYLALIYELRGVKTGRLIIPREDDLVTLSQTLERTPNSIRLSIEQLMRMARGELDGLREELTAKPTRNDLGVLVYETERGALLLEPAPQNNFLRAG